MIGPSLGTTIKFLCSYGGKILPRYPDGKLRYLGGETRVLSVPRSISFSELLLKLGDLCGTPVVSLRCQLPTEDLDALVSITSDEDLANLIEEYDRAPAPPSSLKIRAFLSQPKSAKKTSSPPSSSSSSSKSSSSSSSSSSLAVAASTPRFWMPPRSMAMFPLCSDKSGARVLRFAYHAHGNPGQIYLVHSGKGNHWQ